MTSKTVEQLLEQYPYVQAYCRIMGFDEERRNLLLRRLEDFRAHRDTYSIIREEDGAFKVFRIEHIANRLMANKMIDMAGVEPGALT